MRSIGLDLGTRHIAYCQVAQGEVLDRVAVQRFDQLGARPGVGSAPARVAFEAAREAWHFYDLLKNRGHEPMMSLGLGDPPYPNLDIEPSPLDITTPTEP